MKKQQGFSLIELMIVVAIIGVLTAVAFPAYQNYVKKAEIGSALATLNSLKTAAEDRVLSTSKFPADEDAVGATTSIFTYGEFAVTNNATPDAGGSLGITFKTTSDSSITDDAVLKVTRDASTGKWTCTFTGDEAKASLVPKGCSAI